LPAVLVYQAITYVMPIMIGAAMYLVWRRRTGGERAVRRGAGRGHGATAGVRGLTLDPDWRIQVRYK
jgi:hypothetical protein